MHISREGFDRFIKGETFTTPREIEDAIWFLYNLLEREYDARREQIEYLERKHCNVDDENDELEDYVICRNVLSDLQEEFHTDSFDDMRFGERYEYFDEEIEDRNIELAEEILGMMPDDKFCNEFCKYKDECFSDDFDSEHSENCRHLHSNLAYKISEMIMGGEEK